MPQLRVFECNRGRGVFLNLQMLKRHHRLIIERDGQSYLGFVRPRSHALGDLEIVVPDPMWPEAQPGEPIRIEPEELDRYDVRLANNDEEVWRYVRPMLDMLVP